MFVRCLAFLAVIILGAETTVVRAQTEKKPTVVLRVRSLDAVLDNVRTLVGLVGQEELGRQFEGLIRARIGEQGLEGIDLKRPVGAYIHFGKELEDVGGVIMVPIANEKAFVTLLTNLNAAPTVDKNGIHTVSLPNVPVPVSFRFANQYAYFTAINLDALSPAKMQDPSKLFAGGSTSAVSATIRLDQLPEAAKLLMLASVEDELNKIRDKKQPGETKAQAAFRLEALKEVAKVFATVLEDGTDITAEADLNREKGEFSARWSLSGKPGSNLTKIMANLGSSTSLFAGLKSEQAAVAGMFHAALPPSVRASFEALVDETTAKALESVKGDPKKGKQAEALIQSLLPSLKAGELDAGFELTGPGPNKHYTAVGGVKIKDGDKLAKTLRELLVAAQSELPPQAKTLIQLDADSAGGIKIHRFEFGNFYDAKTRELLGANPLFLALRDDAAFVSAGEEGLAAMKRAVTLKPASTKASFAFEVSVARLVPLMTKLGPADASPKAFAGDDGRVRISVEAGSSLSAQISGKLSVLQFLGGYAGKQLKLN